MSTRPLKFHALAEGLYLAADESGQLVEIRDLIRRAGLIAVEMYGDPGEPDDCDADIFATTLRQFAGVWDEHAAMRKALGDQVVQEASRTPRASEGRSRDVWNYNTGTQAARINELMNIDEFRTVAELYDILSREFRTITEARVRSHISSLKEKHSHLVEEMKEGSRVRYRLLKPSS